MNLMLLRKVILKALRQKVDQENLVAFLFPIFSDYRPINGVGLGGWCGTRFQWGLFEDFNMDETGFCGAWRLLSVDKRPK